MPGTEDPVDPTWSAGVTPSDDRSAGSSSAGSSSAEFSSVGSSPDGGSAAETAKAQATQVGQDAVSSGKQVAGAAAEQTQAVVAEASTQVRNVMLEARSQLSDQASTQQSNLATWVHTLAEDLGSMVDRSDSRDAQGGVATGLARQASDRAHAAATWLDSHEPTDLLEEVSKFARQRPGAFLALAAVGGLLAGRLTRGLTADGSASKPESKPAPVSSRAAVPAEVEPSTWTPTDPPLPSETSVVEQDVDPFYPGTEQGGR